MAGLTRNRPFRDLAAVVLAGLLVLGLVRACSREDSSPRETPEGRSVVVEESDG